MKSIAAKTDKFLVIEFTGTTTVAAIPQKGCC
jgi:hypothetical protein